MKVLFIYPNIGSQVGFNYGIAHMSALLKKAGHAVKLIQLCEEIAPIPSEEEFCKMLKDFSPDVIGFSVVTNQIVYACKFAKIARKTLKNAIITCGGVHATVSTDETVKTGLFDYVFVGECDDVFCDFVSCLERGGNLKEISNLAWLENGEIKRNPVRQLPSFSSLPMKDYSIFDFQKLIDAKDGWVGLMASRGCPFSCTYCFNHKMVKKYRSDLKCSFKQLNYIRHMPIRELIDEIKYLLKNYRGIEKFIFDDDLFTFDKDYLKEFCNEYKKISKIPFVVNAHVGFFDEERAKALAEANCTIVKFGLESGSPKIRTKVMNRHMSNESIKRAISIVNNYGMHSSVFVMIGLPFETKDDLMQTITLLATSLPGRFRWTYFFPYPGTESYDIAMKSGYVNEEKMHQLVNFTDDTCLEFGEEQDLFLKKLGTLMPWFVNAYSNLGCASFYQKKLNEILALSDQQWEKIKNTMRDEDKKISEIMQEKKLSHYAIKYNRFMGVISDYFLNEK